MNTPVRHGSVERPKLLFVTYAFPPAKAIGCIRTWNIAKYLARSGWDVNVLTPDPRLRRYVENPETTEIDLEREAITRLVTGHRWRWLAPNLMKCSNQGLAWVVGGTCRRISRYLGIESTVGWIKAAEDRCSGLTGNDVDIILASGPSFSAFLLAQRLAERLGCPYVLDYRDLWSGNLHHPAPLAVRREASVLQRSAAVTTVSPSWGAVLARQFGVGHKLHIVSNGYDAEELANVTASDFGHFAIVYTGVFYPPKRVICPLMAGLKRLEESAVGPRKGWMFHYYGRHRHHVWEEAERFGLKSRVIVHGDVPRSEAVAAVKGAGVAVVITSVLEAATPEDNGMVTGKIFEAIGLGTPVLLIAPAGSDANAVAETTGLAHTFTAADIDGIASYLDRLMEGEALNPKAPAAYAWENLISGLDRVLRKAIGAPISVDSES